MFTLRREEDKTELNITDDHVARLAVEINGGGWNETQVAEAMVWNRKACASTEGAPFFFDNNGKRYSISPAILEETA